MAYYLGIDGGGTRCTAVVMAADGSEVARGWGGPANCLAVGRERAAHSLRQAIDGVLSKGQLTTADLEATCLGLAGAGRPSIQETARELLQRMGEFQRVTITHDAEIALVGGAGRRYGVVLIAGTGAIAYGVNARGRASRADGWGHLLGDDGSGYWIGRAGLRAALQAYDGRGPSTMLQGRLASATGAVDVDALVECVYGERWDAAQVASIAPLVIECAQQGDQVAQDILREAGRRLACSVGAVVKQLTMGDEDFDLVLSGGLLTGGSKLWPIVAAAVGEIAPRAAAVAPRHDAATGAALLARGTDRAPSFCANEDERNG
jgi:N-acetylglucosamine kinase